MIDQYRDTSRKIQEAIVEETGRPVQAAVVQETAISREELLNELLELKDILDIFEENRAQKKIDSLCGSSFEGRSLADLLGEIRHDVDEFDFETAAEKVSALILRVEGGEVS